ncbi:MAG: hypothetical protein M1834_009719 [Cirrosporium novae-zelandiae]|nr:MAG: hypothetical protein M1834_009719 [Cirrosporium novae-zelandiae]
MADTWESYKETIKNLYLTQNKPLKDVITYMSEAYGFRANKAQYGPWLKAWNFRKNLTSPEWDFIGHRIQKRKRDKKDSNVYINGALIPFKKVKKEVSRNMLPSYYSAPSPQTPEGISVCTPQAFLLRSSLSETLPIFKFLETVGTHDGQALISIHEKWNLALQDGKSSLIDGCSDFSWLFSPGDIKPSYFGTLSTVLDSSFTRNVAITGSDGTLAEIPTPGNCNRLEDTARNTITTSKVSDLWLFLGVFAYRMTNNFIRQEKEIQEFLEWIIENRKSASLKTVLQYKTPTTKTLAQVLLYSAVKLKYMDILLALLDFGVDVNAISPLSCQPPLIIAARDGNIEPVQSLLRAGAHINVCYTEKTALTTAAETGNIALVKFLIQAGADINISEHGHTPLQAAVQKENVTLVRILLDLGADVNIYRTGNKSIILEEAFKTGNNDLVKLLLDTGANIDDATKLHAMIKCDNFEYLTEFLEAGMDINSSTLEICGVTPLQTAIRYGRKETVEFLLIMGANINTPATKYYGLTAFQAAVSREPIDINLVKMLLEAGADVNAPAAKYNGLTALQVAVYRVPIDINLIKIFLEAGADVNAPAAKYYGLTALQAVVSRKPVDIDLVKMLLEAGADVNAPAAYCQGKTALQAAAALGGEIELTQMLLNAGADVNGPAAKCCGYTALQQAVRNRDSLLIRIFLDAGADVNSTATESRGCSFNGICIMHGKGEEEAWGTALQMAARCGNIESVNMLLNAGANINALASESWGQTALQAAAEAGENRVQLVELLLSRGANINAPICKIGGRTALQHAATKNDVDLVRTLLNSGADVNAAAAEGCGFTALQGAAISGNLRIACMLLEAGADIDADPSKWCGRTALGGAAEHGRLDMVQMLMNVIKGRDVPETWSYQIAAKLAEDNGHVVIAGLIRAFEEERREAGFSSTSSRKI